MNNTANINIYANNPIVGHIPAIASSVAISTFGAAATAPAFTLVSSPAGLGPLVPASSFSRLCIAPAMAGSGEARYLLDGFERLLHFLLEEESDFLCGVPNKAHSAQRLNFRAGRRERKLRTPLGEVFIRVPLLRYIHPRVSIAKRAARLSPGILSELERIHAANAVAEQDAAALIKALWTVPLPDTLLATLAGKLARLLEEWRRKAGATTTTGPVAHGAT